MSNGECSSPRTSADCSDGFGIYALFLTVGFALHQLLDAAQYAAIPRYVGYVLATTVVGWPTGGLIVLRATIVGLFFILGVAAAPFLPGDQGKAAARNPGGGAAGGRAPYQLIVNAPSRISKLFRRLRKLIPSSD